MTSFFLAIASLIFFYFSHRLLTTVFSRFIHRLGGGSRLLVMIWSLIFLPGTVFHELSHFLFAILTGARTGKIEIFPDLTSNDWESQDGTQSVTLGYLQTQKLNPLQGFLIGTAPFMVGLLLLTYLSSQIYQGPSHSSIYIFLAQCYLFFSVANSFFPSWSDLHQVLPLTLVIAALLIVMSLLGLNFFSFSLPGSNAFLISIMSVFLLSTGLNLLIVGVVLVTGYITR